MIFRVETKEWNGVTEAVRWTGDNAEEIVNWIAPEFKYEEGITYYSSKIRYDCRINLLEIKQGFSFVTVNDGAYIVKTPSNGFRVYNTQEFESQFEVVFKMEELVNYPKYSVGEFVIYQNGNRFELGEVKLICEERDYYFIYYNTGDVASRTHARNLHKVDNAYAFDIKRLKVDDND